MSEKFEVLDYMGKKTGELKDRKQIHLDGTWHRSRHVHPINSKKGTIMFQQRSVLKDVCPGVLDTAAAGHYAPGESADDALREVYEEIGVNIERIQGNVVKLTGPNIPKPIAAKLIDIKAPHIQIFEQGEPKVINRELQDVSFLDSTLDIENLKLQENEVFAVVEFTHQEIMDLFNGKVDSIKNSSGKKFDKNGKLINFQQSWSRKDFWPTSDNYFSKSAEIAKRIGKGETEFQGI